MGQWLTYLVKKALEVGMENRSAWPTRYLLKIESYSLLSDNGIVKYESNEFESSSYKWKLIIYPNGDEDGHDHISLYLAIVKTSTLPADRDVNATFSFLIFDQIHDNYAVMRGMERRFHNIKTEWGFPKCISQATFKEPSNGYLVNDKCVFGVDIYVIKNRGVGECMSLNSEIESYKYEWKISEFSKLKNALSSDEFTAGAYKWKLKLYPNGDSRQIGQSISIFLESVDAKGFDSQKRVKLKYSISVKNQIVGPDRKKTDGLNWFSAANYSWGWSAFMALSEFKDPKSLLLVGDCCIVEAEVAVVRVVNGFT